MLEKKIEYEERNVKAMCTLESIPKISFSRPSLEGLLSVAFSLGAVLLSSSILTLSTPAGQSQRPEESTASESSAREAKQTLPTNKPSTTSIAAIHTTPLSSYNA